jgi:tellurite methyltransferase
MHRQEELMTDNQFQWENFYRNVSGREPRPLMLDVLKRFEQEHSGSGHKAIDLGCGDGTETALLLSKGWQVFAIDSEPTSFDHLNAKIPNEMRDRLQTQVAKFEDVELVPADLVYAGFSVPFCHPKHFPALWEKIVSSLNPGGRFAGQLFGVRDTWANNPEMTFFTAEQARTLLAGLKVEHFQEEDEDGQSTVGPKHWHIFHVIARKR